LVVKLNIHDSANESLLRQVGASFTPTFILFYQGEERWRRSGVPAPAELRRLVDELAPPASS
jgi:hypothetical protein